MPRVRSLLPLPYGPVVQLVRTPACHAGGRRFEPDPGRHKHEDRKISSFAAIAQSVERILGKDEVGSSNLPSSSIRSLISQEIRLFWYF